MTSGVPQGEDCERESCEEIMEIEMAVGESRRQRASTTTLIRFPISLGTG